MGDDGQTVDVFGVQGRIKAFDAEHGVADSIFEGGWILFPDGAVREANPLGLLSKPPEDDYKLALRKLRYREVALARAVEAFSKRKQYFMQAAKSHLQEKFCGPTPAAADTAAEELEALKQLVLKTKQAYEEMQAEVARTVPEGIKARQRQHEENTQANQALLARLDGIQV
jgi:hypothetical protein